MKQRGKGARNRSEVVDAAAIAFMEYGYTATSIDMVAKKLGSTKGKIYYHFESKMDLFLEVHRTTMARYIAKIDAVAARSSPPADKLRGVLDTLAMEIMENLPFAKVAVQGVDMHSSRSTTPEQREILREIIDLRDRGERIFVDIIEEGVKNGSLRDCDPRLIVKPMLGALNWMTVWYRERPDDTHESRQKISDEIVKYLIRGISKEI